MATAANVAPNVPVRLVGALKNGTVIGASTTAKERVRLGPSVRTALEPIGATEVTVRAKLSALTLNPSLVIHQMLADGTQDDTLGTRAATDKSQTLIFTDTVEQRLSLVVGGARYVEIEVTSGSGESATIDFIEVSVSHSLVYAGNESDVELVLLPSAARTALVNSDDVIRQGKFRGAVLTIDVSAITLTPLLTPKLQLLDFLSGNYDDIWTAAAAIATVSTTSYLFGLGGSGSAGNYTEGVNILLPKRFRLQVGVGDTDSATYSAALVLLR